MKRFINNFQAPDCINILPILDNNTFNIKIIKNGKFHKQKKQIDIQYHFIKKLIEQNKISIDFINKIDILADNFIKALEKPKFENN